MTRTRDRFCFFWLLTTLLVVRGLAFGQEGGQKPAEPVEKTAKEKAVAPEKTASKPELPFQIQLLESHVRFEANGDSRKEVHTIVRINDILGAHQFARLTFDYNRAFQQVEIPLVRISHANGGTSELLPSAVVDAPNPAVEKFPAYQDVRVKSVRILGLQEGDTIEYRVITTTTKHPLAPDFWLEHSFDRSGQVLEERYELDLPGSRNAKVWTSQASQMFEKKTLGDGKETRTRYSWKHFALPASEKLEKPEKQEAIVADIPTYLTEEDVAVTTYADWPTFMKATQKFLPLMAPVSEEVKVQALKVTENAKTAEERLRRLYNYVAHKISTVDLPLTATGFATHSPQEILAAGQATPEDKCVLLMSLAAGAGVQTKPALAGPQVQPSSRIPALPMAFTSILLVASDEKKRIWLDPSEPVIPFEMITANLRGKAALLPYPDSDVNFFEIVPDTLPFPSFQKVGVDAVLTDTGQLSARVKYVLRGDNELLLRVAFHQTAKEKWKDVAGLLAIADGFRGQVTSVNVSDPMETKDPFIVEYEIRQTKFVDWLKKPVRIPALLPQIGLPDPPAKSAAGEAARKIELGTPLDVETQMTLKLPTGTTAQAPAGTSVERDYAKFTSTYVTAANSVTASRRVNFLLREIPGDRAMDYSAFVRAVQSDEAQSITLLPAAADNAKPGKATPKQ
ncbi:MAG: DUF3857 domain-containing protein [Candidatus Acidiferrum sp.]